jgi:hypothetical protein
MSSETITDSRKEFHGGLSPAIYTRFALENIVPRIENFTFPGELIDDPIQLYSATIDINSNNEDGITRRSVTQLANDYGIKDLTVMQDIHRFGFGDQNFIPMFTSGLSVVVGNYIQIENISQEISLTDHAKIMQSSWFRTMATQLALTGAGILQPALLNAIEKHNVPNFLERAYRTNREKIIEHQKDDSSGLFNLYFSKSFIAKVRDGLQLYKDISVGCPVARTAFATSTNHANFLKNNGHLDESSGFYIDKELPSGKVKIERRDDVTVIDEALVTWADYVYRYANSKLFEDLQPAEGIISTDLENKINLD